MAKKPHIVMIVNRGEAVRNFLYSDTLNVLSENARVTLFTPITDEKILGQFRNKLDDIIFLNVFEESRLVRIIDYFLHYAHFRWIWSEVAKNVWEMKSAPEMLNWERLKWIISRPIFRILANKPSLEILHYFEQKISYWLRPTQEFDKLFMKLKPDLIFLCSQVHGLGGDLPIKIAHGMGIKTSVFIFSWDNLTSRSRIFPYFDYWFVWNQSMKNQLINQYSYINPQKVFVTGTPQFDFHFKKEFEIDKMLFFSQLGLDPTRPYILYTTGMAQHFPEEHRTVRFIIEELSHIELPVKPQLVIRPYIKDTSKEMLDLSTEFQNEVIFTPVFWEPKWFTPLLEDLFLYTNLVRYATLGINPASTVSLELLIHKHPVINIGFDPPGSNLPKYLRWSRHINFDHFKPLVESKVVNVAWTPQQLVDLITQFLKSPAPQASDQHSFLHKMFDGLIDGNSGKRIGEKLIELADEKRFI